MVVLVSNKIIRLFDFGQDGVGQHQIQLIIIWIKDGTYITYKCKLILWFYGRRIFMQRISIHVQIHLIPGIRRRLKR